jgi:hypothetical protein
MSARTATLIPREMSDPRAALLAAYHRSDERGRESVLEYALRTGENWPEPLTQSAPSTRLEKLIAQVSELSAMLASAPSLKGAEQVEFLLDCSSLADDLSRDLDVLVGEPK